MVLFYADDTSCLVRDETSVEKLFEKLEAFRGCCGLEMNRVEKNYATIDKPFQNKLAHEVCLSRRFFLL